MSTPLPHYPRANDPLLFDQRGHRRTASMFYETQKDDYPDPPLFTLKDHEFKGYPSIQELYLSASDEYDAALKIVGCMAHWRKLLNCPWFRNGEHKRGIVGIDQWRADMASRDASLAKKVLLEKVRGGDRSSAALLLKHSIEGKLAGVLAPTKTQLSSVKRGIQSPAPVAPTDISRALDRLRENP